MGISAPFWTSNSAMGNAKGFGGGGSDRGEVDGVVDSDAGSAAAKAKKIPCVFRDRSVTLGLAPSANPYNTPGYRSS